MSPRSRGRRAAPATCPARRGLVARLGGHVDQLQRARGQALAELGVAEPGGGGTRRHSIFTRPRASYCGVDISAKPANQQLVTLHERRGAEGLELVATFYAPGTVEQVARTIQGFGAGETVVGGRRAVRPPARPARAGRAARAALGLPDGRYERMRVCDALLFRRGLPLYPVPAEGQPPHDLGALDRGRLRAVRRARVARALPAGGRGAYQGDVGAGALGHGRLCETYPDAIFCALLGHRPSPKRTPWGLQQRIAALKPRAIVDEDGGLWHRTLDELDACAAAYAAYGLAAGLGTWVGDPEEGVIVLPTADLLDRYEKLPPPARAALA